jgi:hypothetical protein
MTSTTALNVPGVLDRVVDDQQVGPLAGQWTADAGRDHATRVALDLPGARGRVGRVNADAEQRLAVLLQQGARLAAPAGGKVRLVGGEHDAPVGVAAEVPGGQVARDRLRLAVPRRHRDDQPFELVVADPGQLLVQGDQVVEGHVSAARDELGEGGGARSSEQSVRV